MTTFDATLPKLAEILKSYDAAIKPCLPILVNRDLYGYITLCRQNSLERFIGNLAIIAVATNWLITLLTIGDHRFRIPIMGLSLFLQAIGLKTLFKGGKAPIVDGPSLR